jgi:hypothetical protein
MNYNISPAHFVAIAESLKPTNDFNIDAKAIMDIGDLLNKVINHQKWTSCPNLETELFQVLSRHFSEVPIDTAEISSILAKARADFDSPSITELYVSDYIKTKYNAQIGFTYDITDTVKGRLFMAFIDKIYLYISDLYKKYKKSWDDIEDSYDMVNEHVSEIFKYLDDNEDVKIMEEIDEEISQIVSINIKHGYYTDGKKLEADILKKYKDCLDERRVTEQTQNTIIEGNVKTQIALHKINWQIQTTKNLFRDNVANYYSA